MLGGVGKSSWTTLLTCWLLEQGIKPIVFETDRGNANVASIFQNNELVKLDFACFSEHENELSKADPIILKASEPGNHVVINLPGQVQYSLYRWLLEDEVGLLARELNIALNYFFVSNGSFESFHIFQEVMSKISSILNVNVLVLNEFNRSPQWEENMAQFDEVFEQHKTKIIEMAKLRSATFELVKSYNLSFSEAVSDPRLNLVESQRIKTFLRKNYQQLDLFKKYFIT